MRNINRLYNTLEIIQKIREKQAKKTADNTTP